MANHKTAFPEARSHAVILVGLLLFLAVLIIYYPATQNQFTHFDDNLYVTANRMVAPGLTPRGIREAFTSTTAGNWQPLTMLSLELDAQVFGKEPAGFHLTNLILHAASTCLLFLVCQRTTGRVWESAWVAAMFAWHPLHVESVAWVAERKDVLSCLFWMLTLLAYVWYTERPGWRRYVCVAVTMTLGLMSKAMLVTLPCLLLVLDYWPLGRFKNSDSPTLEPGQAASSQGTGHSFWSLLTEKIPLFALALIFSVITVWTQQRAHLLHTFAERSLPLRLENAVLAYAVYLYQMVWPVDMAPYYPLAEEGWPRWQVAGALVLLLAVTAMAWAERRRRPFLLVGWLWYLGTLVPVIGLVPVGAQAWADRYTYVSLVGIFLLLAWGVEDLCATWRLPRKALILPGITILILCAFLTRIQIGYWHDDKSLWQHALESNPRNDVAHNNLGAYLSQHGKPDEAMAHWVQAVALNPKNDKAQVNVATGLLLQKKPAEAERRLVEALQVHAENPAALILLAGMRFRQDRQDEAMSLLKEALRLRPEDVEANFLVGEIFAAKGEWQTAAQHFAVAVRGLPVSAQGHHRLGRALIRLRRWPEAAASLRQAVDLRPKEVPYRCDLALALYEAGETEKALAQFREASLLQPDWPDQLNAFVLSRLSGKESKPGQAEESVDAAKEICQATHFSDPRFLDTLAAAYAETGHFEEAVRTARKALDLALAAKQTTWTRQIEKRIKYYEQHRSFREADAEEDTDKHRRK